MTDRLLDDLADRARNRWYGKYRGQVTAVDETTLRIKATVPSVLGSVPTGWCLPCVPYAGPQVGFFFLPEAGAAVWIEFEGGDVSYPIWVGCFWRAGEIPGDATPVRRGLVTKAPHKLVFDDDAGEVTVADANGGSLLFGSDGVTISAGSGTVAVSDSGVSLNDDAFKVS
ncbi:phage baseplate assembly protein V [Actinoplanes sp. NPDC026619]|uniref:phage baseplate assembly protein V n=1 Tax=Actinoplanes sp. NPDC026619 TaxID=3155798 RepID=UPI0033D290F1